MNSDLAKLLTESAAAFAAMTPEQKDAMIQQQRESYVRAETSWPKAKYKYVNGVKVYDSYEDYCND